MDKPYRVYMKEEIANLKQQPEEKNLAYLEFVKDIAHSDSMAMTLINGVQMSVMNWNGVAISLLKLMALPDRTGKIGEAILENKDAFYLPLSLMFMGIAIGRKMAADEAGTQKDLDWLKSLDLTIDPNEPEKS